jgi:hypothetical protein
MTDQLLNQDTPLLTNKPASGLHTSQPVLYTLDRKHIVPSKLCQPKLGPLDNRLESHTQIALALLLDIPTVAYLILMVA